MSKIGENLISEHIIEVDKCVDVEDVLEKRAIGDVYPWKVENRVMILGANAGLLVILLCTTWALRKRLKEVKPFHCPAVRGPNQENHLF